MRHHHEPSDLHHATDVQAHEQREAPATSSPKPQQTKSKRSERLTLEQRPSLLAAIEPGYKIADLRIRQDAPRYAEFLMAQFETTGALAQVVAEQRVREQAIEPSVKRHRAVLDQSRRVVTAFLGGGRYTTQLNGKLQLVPTVRAIIRASKPSDIAAVEAEVMATAQARNTAPATVVSQPVAPSTVSEPALSPLTSPAITKETAALKPRQVEEGSVEDIYIPTKDKEYFLQQLRFMHAEENLRLNELAKEGTLSLYRENPDPSLDFAEDQRRDAIMKRTRKKLNLIETALSRIERGTYGICIDTGDEISYRRLCANPIAFRSEERQTQMDRLSKVMDIDPVTGLRL